MISKKLQDGYLSVRLFLLSLAGKDGSFPIPSRFPSSKNKDTIALLRDDEEEVKLSLHYRLVVFVWVRIAGLGAFSGYSGSHALHGDPALFALQAVNLYDGQVMNWMRRIRDAFPCGSWERG
ncbi:MAG: hypothetical protein FD168_2070 [Desulfobulbaceae bacterium]|nr:MAG: hypothetical protein FD168_2070 [Desulfobulbaceae bacterium]